MSPECGAGKAEGAIYLGSMAIMLEIASHIDALDYDTFFRCIAGVWKTYMSENLLKSSLLSDVHPPGHVRTNVVVLQFDKFYQTYTVTPGDDMYLAPEERLSVW